MSKIALEGVGPVSPIGVGKECFWASVLSNVSGVKKVSKVESLLVAGEIRETEIEDFVKDKRFRRAAGISKYALAAAKLAFDDSGGMPRDGARTALIVAVTHGPLNYTDEFYGTVVNEEDASPLLFSDSVLNAPAGNCSVFSMINGPVHTLVGGATVGIKAFELGCDYISMGIAETVIIVSAEELNRLSFACYSRFGMGPLAEGAAATVIRKKTEDKPSRYGCISAIRSRHYFCGPESGVDQVVEDCLYMAHVGLKDIALFVAQSDFTESVMPSAFQPVGSIYRLTGNAFAVSTMWNLIFSGLILANRTIPARILRSGSEFRSDPRYIMICCAEREGSVAAALLARE